MVTNATSKFHFLFTAIEAIKELSSSKFEHEGDCSIDPVEDAVVSLISLAAQQAVQVFHYIFNS